MKTLRTVLFLLLVVVLVAGCNNIFGGDDKKDGGGDEPPAEPNPTTSLTFNLDGATAVGAAEMNVDASNLTGSSLMGSQAAESAFGLVKVLEDGSIEMAMEAPENIWLPDVQFIAVSPDANNKGVFASFEHEMHLGWDDEAQQEIRLSSFLHIEPDGTYYEVLDKQGRVRNYTWHGDDSYKPVTFDGDGNLYYVWEDWAGGDSVEVLYRYDPDTHTSTALTAQLSGYRYNSFRVNEQGNRLFVQGARHSGSARSNFFRMYSVADMTNPKTVFYSSNDNVWVRGYIVNGPGDTIYMNGNNIRDINGIIRADVISNSEIEYDPMFDSSNEYFTPMYYEWYDEYLGETRRRGLFDRISVWESYVVMTDGANFRYVSLQDVARRYAKTNYVGYRDADGTWSNDLRLEDLWFAGDLSDASVKGAEVQEDANNWVLDDGTDGVVPLSGLHFVRAVSEWNNGVETSYYKAIQEGTAKNFVDYARDNGGTQEVYAWNEYWLDDAGELRTESLTDYLVGFFVSNIEFAYGGLTGDAAWTAFEADGPYDRGTLMGSTGSSSYFLENYFNQAGSVSPAKTFQQFKDEANLEWLNFQDVSNMFFVNGELWGVVGGGNWGVSNDMRPLRLLDASGEKSLAVHNAFVDDTYTPVGFLVDGNTLYFRDAVLDQDGFETGYHELYRVDLSTMNSTPELVLANAGLGRVEIVDFSIGGDFLYFTAVEGITLVGGKVNTQTLAYTPFNSEYVIQNIEVY